ncbi:hypothetical protein L7F22_064981 [Adiantum nelumboides]|nr:hypothetical protein [Adiantum nelumboides]
MRLVSLKLKHSRWLLRRHGLEPKLVELENGSTIHCWVPVTAAKTHRRRSKVRGYEHDYINDSVGLNPACHERASDHTKEVEYDNGAARKPALLLLHGFGTDGTLSWDTQLCVLTKDFRVYIPDLVCFGKSTTTNEQRSELFQAECMLAMMHQLGIRRAAVAGHSYGGFVAFSMAHRFPDFVTCLIVINSGIMMNPSTNHDSLHELRATKSEDILAPSSVSDTKKGFKIVYDKLPSWLPTCLFKEPFQVCTNKVPY